MPLQSGFMIFFFFLNRSHTDFVYNCILVSCHDYISLLIFLPLTITKNNNNNNNKYKKEKKKRTIAYI